MAEEPLTEDIIKELHRILKQSTKDSSLAWFAVGDYKKRANMVGGHETAKPEEVATYSPIPGWECNTETLAESGITAANCFVYKIE